MRALPAEEKAKIERLSTELRSEKSRFESMLSQWDEAGNEIVVLAKKMCMMMMDMSDFTRYNVVTMSNIACDYCWPTLTIHSRQAIFAG